MTVRLTQIARNGTVCHAGSNRIAARLIATKATHAISTHDERVQVKACPDHAEASCRGRPARLLTAAAAGCRGAHRTKRWTDTSPPNLAAAWGSLGNHAPSANDGQALRKGRRKDYLRYAGPRWRHAPAAAAGAPALASAMPVTQRRELRPS